ncbi:hypothetical protein SDRG_11153 [Saprolegnia diclina VS20]|uniref:Ion transport domain-containing protein n=1 Tax=Saprolegnia diclina (strain VS20) TaxID=1156394 RepID=T0QCE5_SAPDV|nr:hypothetical protein SDRG_11153 [Saprolegnia diclina VS20]EQC31230.1 hypothetical protein SDRG_11153 [Saprolegnia diclina VS20]|eukprot:XP_008615403.1 hypothetical protein SDRG_11153 [Saprolegnia diclina VS20]
MRALVLLLRAGADVNAVNKSGKTAAELTTDIDVADVLAKEAAFRSEFPVHCIARCNNVAAIDAWLAEMSASAAKDVTRRMKIERAISATDKYLKDGRSVLMYAVDAIDVLQTDQVLNHLLPHCSIDVLKLQDKYGKSTLDYLLEKDIVCTANIDGASNAPLVKALDALSRQSTLPLCFAPRATLPRGGAPPRTCSGACMEAGRSRTVHFAQLAADGNWTDLATALQVPVDEDAINGYTALHHICIKANVRMLQLLVQQPKLDLSMGTHDEPYLNALQLALVHDFEDGVRILLAAGAPHCVYDAYFAARICKMRKGATASENLALDSWELEHRYPAYYLVRLANVTEAERCIGAKETPLHVAVRKASPLSIVEKLLETDDVDMDARNDNGETALLIAVKNGSMDHVKCLLTKGADAELCDKNDRSPLMFAAEQGKLELIELLMEHLDDLPAGEVFFRSGRFVYGIEVWVLFTREGAVRNDSKAFLHRRAVRMVTLRVNDAFTKNTFLKAISCSAALVQTYLNDCVSMNRHDISFFNLRVVYGTNAKESPLYTILNLNLKDADETFAAQKLCLEHAVFRRLLEIKWELFGRRMYVERLLMHLLLLVTMTISSILFGDAPPSSTSYGISLTTLCFTAVGYVAAQGLRPRTYFARFEYYRFWPSRLRLHLALLVIFGTVVTAVPLLRAADALAMGSWYATFNHVLLGLTASYFIINEVQEMHGDRRQYFSATINVVQLVNYGLILGLFVPMKLNWIPTADIVQVGVGAILNLVLWVLSLQFLEVVSSASYLLPMMARLFGDVWNFFLIFGIFQIGLTLIFYQLFVLEPDAAFSSLGQSFMSTYFVTFGQVPLDALQAYGDGSDSYASTMYTGLAILMMAHSAIVVVILLNVLLAMMNQTVTSGLEKARTQALISYARCILRLEITMNLSEKDVEHFTHVVDNDGKMALHRIFTERSTL